MADSNREPTGAVDHPFIDHLIEPRKRLLKAGLREARLFPADLAEDDAHDT